MIRIIGLGSPFGDDSAGCVAARRLALDPPPHSETVVADRPGCDLVDLLRDVEAAILIDAVRSGAPAGTLHDLDLRAVQMSGVHPVSSHELGVVEALSLAEALGTAPRYGRLLGIEVGAERFDRLDELSTPVREAIAATAERARQWVARFS